MFQRVFLLATALLISCSVYSTNDQFISPQSDLSPALLTTRDFPEGWALLGIDSNALTPDIGRTYCTQETGKSWHVNRVAAGFQKNEAGPTLLHIIETHASDQAEQAFSYWREQAKECNVWDKVVGQSTVPTNIRKLSFPTLGDETLAIHETSEGIEPKDPILGNTYAKTVIIRQGNVIVTLSTFSVGAADIGGISLEGLARTSIRRLNNIEQK